MNKTPTTLIIMDGFGLSNDTVGNAVRAANTPCSTAFCRVCPHDAPGLRS